MNTANNRRRQETINKIESVFSGLLRDRELHQITVSEICEKAGINRSSFYLYYMDIYDLADKLAEKIERAVTELLSSKWNGSPDSDYYTEFFRFVSENRQVFSAYYRLGLHDKFIYKAAAASFSSGTVDYSAVFYSGGHNHVTQRWLENGCKESPEEMARIMNSKYIRCSEFWSEKHSEDFKGRIKSIL